MAKYLLSIWQPDGPPPPHIGQIMKDVQALDAEMKAANVWVFGNGLTPADSATVVRTKNGEALLTDGPYVEAKEHLGGFVVLEAADLDGALKWAKKLSKATTLPIEVRAFVDGPHP